MSKFRKRLARITAALGATLGNLSSAQKHWRALHDAAHAKLKQSRTAALKAGRYRKAGDSAKAAKHDRRAMRLEQEAKKIGGEAKVEIARVHALKDKTADLSRRKAELKAKIKEASGLHADGNKVKGKGSGGKKVMFAWHVRAASGKGFRYSQSGPFTAEKFLTGEPAGYRQDCSQAYIASFWSADLPSPSGSWVAGFTGSIADHGTRIDRNTAAHTPAAAVEWGSYPFHHIEAAEGDGTTDTMGHGSPPYDRGNFDLLGPADAFYELPGI